MSMTTTTVGDVLRAVRAKDEAGLKRLLQACQEAETSINLDEEVNQTTALVEAVLTDQPSMVRALIDAGADINAGCAHAVSPLCVAAAVDKIRMAHLLLEQGADIAHLADKRPLCQVATPLHFAVQNHSMGMTRLLLEAGHDPNYPSHMYDDPITEAIKTNCVGIVRLLAAHPRCKVNGRIDGYGTWNYPPLHQALFRYRRYDAAQAILDAERAAISFRSESYLCHVLWRARDNTFRHRRMACMLLEAGADLDSRDRQGQAPIESFVTGVRGFGLTEAATLLRFVVEAGVTPTLEEVALIEKHVKTEADRQVADLIREVATSPRSLRDLGRRMIRKRMGLYPMSRLKKLELPQIISDFLTLQYLRDFH